jgi:hypothetical protein
MYAVHMYVHDLQKTVHDIQTHVHGTHTCVHGKHTYENTIHMCMYIQTSEFTWQMPASVQSEKCWQEHTARAEQLLQHYNVIT